MGLYDEIHGSVKCPRCNNITTVSEQVKWTHDPYLHCYKVGDIIDADDGCYEFATYSRPVMFDICEVCGSELMFSVNILHGKVDSIKVISSRLADGSEGSFRKDKYREYYKDELDLECSE